MKIKNIKYPGAFIPGIVLIIFSGMLIFSGCSKLNQTEKQAKTYGPSLKIVYLVSDSSIFPASRYDPNLVDAWGIAISPNGNIWIACSNKGISTVYDGTGATVLNPVEVTSGTKGVNGQPTGIVFNSTTDFVIPATGTASKFIFAGLDGGITAWNSGDSTKTMATKTGASYTGITLANDGTGNFLYAANFAQGTIDVLDKNFNFVSGRPFTDPNLPSGYNPYNIQNLGGLLYVTYSPTGNGNYGNNTSTGYVNVFNPDGTFVKRFASGGTLAFPWGVTVAPAGLGIGQNMILIGNFMNGTVGAYDANGVFQGLLYSYGIPLVIPGLWGIVTAPASAASLDQTAVYFAAGPMYHTHGAFGYFKKQ